MAKSFYSILLLVPLLVFSGCASIDFYEENIKNETITETGYLYYPPKPYLLVGTKDNELTTQIISLPDLSRPHRVKQNNGWGTAELGFVIENGMIKSFNSKSDSKGPETLSAIASLGSAKAAIDTAAAAMLEIELAATDKARLVDFDSKEEFDLPREYKVKVFEEISNSITTVIIPTLSQKKAEFKNEICSLNEINNKLSNNQTITINYKPFKPDALLDAVEDRRKLAAVLAVQLKNVSTTLDVYANNDAKKPELILPAKNANTELKEVIKSISTFSLRSNSAAGLYEIKYINGELNLRKVLLD